MAPPTQPSLYPTPYTLATTYVVDYYLNNREIKWRLENRPHAQKTCCFVFVARGKINHQETI